MVTSVPAWFGSKGRTRKPAGLDVTTVTDTSSSMNPYVNFITSSAVYQSLETALRSQNIGVSSQNENKYSFCVALNPNDVQPSLDRVEKDVVIGGSAVRWATGQEVIDDIVAYPTYTLTGSAGENVAASLNTIQAEYRDYNETNQRITIGGSDAPGYMANITSNPTYPSIYVGVHSLYIRALGEDPNTSIPPEPSGVLVGFVYTTDTVGTAIYIEGNSINYRENMPTYAISVSPGSTFGNVPNALNKLINQTVATNGALYNITFFSTPEKYTLLAESLGTVLGKYLYSIS